jgi:hypothetical protein
MQTREIQKQSLKKDDKLLSDEECCSIEIQQSLKLKYLSYSYFASYKVEQGDILMRIRFCFSKHLVQFFLASDLMHEISNRSTFQEVKSSAIDMVF